MASPRKISSWRFASTASSALLLIPALLAIPAGCSDTSSKTSQFLEGRPEAQYGYKVVSTYDHDPENFTEGLDLEGGILYESTGLNGRSRLMKEDLASGETLAGVDLDPTYFGEGVTVLKGEVFQLTYQSGICFVYDPGTLALKRTFQYSSEGWGLSDDGGSLIMSNGTSTLSYLDSASGKVMRTLEVRDSQGPVSNLNELEYVDGVIYANIWQQDVIVMISPESGEVEGWIDLTGLRPQGTAQGSVLNGIAFDSSSGNLLVTGKYWPKLFEIEQVPR